ncbi:MAG: hypothetical protein KI791_06830 [Cyclobacteriaceae bacterium]|nr:hypothetical protein [Cyclobacteriaceae bacterium SS2]
MHGRKPIFATLVSDFIDFTRDLFYRLLLEPESHAKRRAKRMKKSREEKLKG